MDASNHHLSRPRRFIAAAAIIALACISRAQDTVALRALARPASGTAVTLADIADLSGPQSAALASIVISADAAPGEIDLAAVRKAVDATPGINAGRIIFSGSVCGIRSNVVSPAPVPSNKPASRPSTEGTVRQHVAARIAETLNVPPQDLRLTFEDNHEDLLNTRTQGRIVTAQQTGAGERIALAVRVYEGDTLIVQGSLAVGVLIRREVGVLQSPVSRGDLIPAEIVTTTEQWLPPTIIPAPVATIGGRTARARIAAGEVVVTRDTEPSLAISKGDFLALDCISGSIVIRTTAKALADAKEGETILVETIQWRKTISAKVSGPGHAVAVGHALENDPSKPARRKAAK